MTKKLNFKSILSLLLVVVFTLSMGLTVFAAPEAGSGAGVVATADQATIEKDLVDSVINGSAKGTIAKIHDGKLTTTNYLVNISNKSYKMEGGGSMSGSQIIAATTGYPYYTFKEDNFNKLSSDGKTNFMQDIVDNSNKIKSSVQNKADITQTMSQVDNDTINEFWSNLQNENGIGVTFMTTILQHTKPDFVRANQIYEPFSGVVGTILGLGAVLIMALLGIVMVADIAYIALPPVRMLADGKEKGGIGSHLFSAEALHAVEKAEKDDKNALAYYFKKRVIMLIVLGICLLYLIQGRIYTLVGWVLNLLSGVL